MESVTISKFKATCLALLDRVKRTGQPILVTRRGEPIAEIVPAKRSSDRSPWVGSLVGTGRIVGDTVAPGANPDEWEALRE
jgi:prevent-host-death family protein